jgi:hypothetical protein
LRRDPGNAAGADTHRPEVDRLAGDAVDGAQDAIRRDGGPEEQRAELLV